MAYNPSLSKNEAPFRDGEDVRFNHDSPLGDAGKYYEQQRKQHEALQLAREVAGAAAVAGSLSEQAVAPIESVPTTQELYVAAVRHSAVLKAVRAETSQSSIRRAS